VFGQCGQQFENGSHDGGGVQGVKGNSVELFLDCIHNGISFKVHNAAAMIFAVRSLQFGVPVRPMALMYPGAAAGNNASFLHSALNLGGGNITLQQVNNHTDKNFKELVAEIRGRIYNYYVAGGNLSASQWKDVEIFLY